jgi:hypothetical protein
MQTKQTKRLDYLASMLVKYQQAWWRALSTGTEPSNRMYSWVDEYNQIKADMSYRDWCTWCEENGSDPSHNALDYFA